MLSSDVLQSGRSHGTGTQYDLTCSRIKSLADREMGAEDILCVVFHFVVLTLRNSTIFAMTSVAILSRSSSSFMYEHSESNVLIVAGTRTKVWFSISSDLAVVAGLTEAISFGSI